MATFRRFLSVLLLIAALPLFATAQLGFAKPPSKERKVRPLAQPETFSFWSLASMGTGPGLNTEESGLIQASDGFLYGTAGAGGANNGGTVFMVAAENDVLPVYSFCSLPNCADGSGPYAGLIEGVDGNLYGTTIAGGANSAGTVFRVSLTGVETVLYSFCSQGGASCTDGVNPMGQLTQAADGKLYGISNAARSNNGGITPADGTSTSNGVLFSIDPAGSASNNYNFAVIYNFGTNASDGIDPWGGLLQGSDGNIYGVTILGGSGNAGTLFQYSISSGALATLYSFCSLTNCTDGIQPRAQLVETADGSLWGSTVQGGTGQYGTIFRWDGAALTTESAFDSSTGAYIYAPLFLGSDGNFYGGTDTGGAYGNGSVFQMVPGASPVTNYLYEFGQDGNGYGSGAYVNGGMVQAFGGDFYGLTTGGGPDTTGTVFGLYPDSPLAGPVNLYFSPAGADAPTPAAIVFPGQSIPLQWAVSNAYSMTMQQCFASVLGNTATAGAWSGWQSGEVTNGAYNGSATITPAAMGDYIYVLTCGGQESGAAFLQVGETPVLAATASPSATITLGGAVTLNVNASGSGPAPTGAVTFAVGTATLGSVTLLNGAASITPSTTGLPAGTYAVTVSYSGDSNYRATAVTVPVTIEKFSSTTALAVASNAVSEGQPVTLNVTVTGAASATPQGSVSFYTSTGYLAGSAALNTDGMATLTYNTPVAIVGPYMGYATYTGSTTYSSSTSNSVAVTIAQAPTSTTLGETVNMSTGLCTFQVTVNRTASGATGNPGGYVGLIYKNKQIASQALSSGAATITLPTAGIPAGTYSVGVIYYGDQGDQGSTATPISVTVN